MRWGSWNGVLGLAATVLLVDPALAQLGHKQRWSAAPCCPSEMLAPSVEPPREGEPIPLPKGAEPVPAPLVEATDFVPDLPSEPLSTFDSSVGYIDSAIPANLLRLRIDAAYGSNRATRAEFFYAKGGPAGPGLPLAELQDDYQEILLYGEKAWTPCLSSFLELPIRFINPEINDNHAGYGDMNFGFKYAFLYCPDRVASFQWRTWVPTGDAGKGLGNDHVSLEPALLFYQRLSEQLRLEGELRYWIPVGGTDFAGDVIRYGIGLSYGERPADTLWVTPVVELVGWTVLDGQETVTPPLVPAISADAAGDTIVNVKLGLRLGLGNVADFYMGYGRALTGEVWYEDIWRTELRLAF